MRSSRSGHHSASGHNLNYTTITWGRASFTIGWIRGFHKEYDATSTQVIILWCIRLPLCRFHDSMETGLILITLSDHLIGWPRYSYRRTNAPEPAHAFSVRWGNKKEIVRPHVQSAERSCYQLLRRFLFHQVP